MGLVLLNRVALGPYIVLAIGDTGVGIEPDRLPHVFEPFYTTKRHGAGSGLGLATGFGFAKQSNGHVTLDSEPGLGTTVRLFLPALADCSTLVTYDAWPAEAADASGLTCVAPMP